MINGKTFYQVLGVLTTAEDLVIRAAYRSLSNKYHPDKWTGDKKVAHDRMSEINAAYATLGDGAKRQKYDDELKKQGKYDDAADIDDNNSDFEGIYSEHSDAWDIAIQFYPGLNDLHERLRKINSPLAYTFKTILLEKKDYKKGAELAGQLEHAFLVKYFGKNESILAFAKFLITNNIRSAARELNRIVNVMGASVNVDQVDKVLRTKYPEIDSIKTKVGGPKDTKELSEILARAKILDITAGEAIKLIEEAGYTKVHVRPHWFHMHVYEFIWIDGSKWSLNHLQPLLTFVRDNVIPLYQW